MSPVHTTSSTTTTVHTSSTTTRTTAVTTCSTTTRIAPTTYAPPGLACECEGGGGHGTTKEEKKPVQGGAISTEAISTEVISTEAYKESYRRRRDEDEDSEEGIIEGVDYMYEITDEMLEKGVEQHNPLCDNDHFGDFDSEEMVPLAYTILHL